MNELIPGATEAGMTNMQCTELLETAQDTLAAITSTLTYLLDQENQKAQPDTALIAEWEALQRVISTHQQRNNELAVVADRYSAEQQR